MTFAGFPDEAFAFYEGLSADNSKTYWTAHKDVYERAVREPMLALVEELGPKYGEAKIFRPYRDVRFSADKSPYKDHQGAYFSAAGGIGYYLQVSAEGLMVAGGFYGHDKELTARYRAAVDSAASGERLEKIVVSLARQGFSAGGDQVRSRPRGCPADHPRLELMRHQSLYAWRRHDPGPEVESPTALDLVRKDWRKLTPLVDWATTYVAT
jgi:uncharacterized protein (TIGR02453 family)